MARFSRGFQPEARRDIRRLWDASSAADRSEFTRCLRELRNELAEDPHLKGEACPQDWNPHLRRLDCGALRMFFWVRQPPLDHLYAEAIAFSRLR
jgi:hypothetical protein